MAGKAQNKKALIHLVGSWHHPKFQTLLQNTDYSLDEAYGKLWRLLEEIASSDNQRLDIENIPDYLDTFAIRAVKVNLVKQDGAYLYSSLINKTLQVRKEPRETRAKIIIDLQQENKKLRDELSRVQRLLKLKPKVKR